jgi:hypothetical protein
MATTLASQRRSPVREAPLEAPRTVVPIKWWAGIGAAFIALFAYLWIAWLGFGNTTRTPAGPDPMPGGIHAAVVAWQFIFPAGLAWCAWVWIIKPWRAAGRIQTDGLMCLAMLTMYWQDLVPNMFKTTFVYNSAMLNWGSWANFVPGWISPNGETYAEPLIFAFPSYIAMVMPGMAIGCWVMRRLSARKPRMGKFGLFMACFATLAIIDLVVEPAWLMLGLYSYVAPIRSLTIFGGHYYQFPVYEAILWPLSWSGMACLRHFKDDKGRTVVERGIDSLRVTGRARTGVRFLAFAGIFNVLLLAYNGTWAVLGIMGDSWPKDVAERSYFHQQLCGEGTDYACPTLGVPIAHHDSASINPRGELVVPDGTVLPGGIEGPATIPLHR